MRRIAILAVLGLVALSIWGSPVGASSHRTLVLPLQANSSPVIYLGQARDPASGKNVEGYAFIHRRESAAKPGGGAKPGAVCYTYLAKDAKWKTLEPWVVNPANTRGLQAEAVVDNMNFDVAKWESAAGAVNILGAGTTTSAELSADTAAPDGVNEAYFADVSSSGAIAVTIVWGYFSGPPQTRALVEWDMVFDDTDFDWSATGDPAKMDFENIATHELGHSVGMGDLYDTACAAETMYGYASLGETQKRDLNTGDIAGINKLY